MTSLRSRSHLVAAWDFLLCKINVFFFFLVWLYIIRFSFFSFYLVFLAPVTARACCKSESLNRSQTLWFEFRSWLKCAFVSWRVYTTSAGHLPPLCFRLCFFSLNIRIRILIRVLKNACRCQTDQTSCCAKFKENPSQYYVPIQYMRIVVTWATHLFFFSFFFRSFCSNEILQIF